MRKPLLLVAIISVFFILSGCKVVEEREAVAQYRPDRYWEKVWVVEEKVTHLKATPETITMTASCIIKYEGEEPAEDVTIVMRSPLTYDFIGEQEKQKFDIIAPGEQLEYRLQLEVDNWRERIPVGVFQEKLVDDFQGNSYIGVSWRYGEDEYDIRFYDWGDIEHWF